MMTIFSDAKNENTKALISKSVEELRTTAKDIKTYTESFEKKSDEQKDIFERILTNSKDILVRTKDIQKDVHDFNGRLKFRSYEAGGLNTDQYEEENVGDLK